MEEVWTSFGRWMKAGSQMGAKRPRRLISLVFIDFLRFSLIRRIQGLDFFNRLEELSKSSLRAQCIVVRMSMGKPQEPDHMYSPYGYTCDLVPIWVYNLFIYVSTYMWIHIYKHFIMCVQIYIPLYIGHRSLVTANRYWLESS